MTGAAGGALSAAGGSGKPTHVTVLGTGAMGCDIAAIFVAAGVPVHAVATSLQRRAECEAHVQRSVAQIGLSVAEAAPFVLLDTLDTVPWRATSLVIETVPEKLALKQALFEELLQRAPPDVPVVSNASGFPITRIAGHLPTAERTAGLHFFLPAHLVPVVEVVQGEKTREDIVHRVHGYMQAVGRVPVRVNRDTPGFLANRIQHALMREAFAVVEEGLATPEDVDAAVRFGFGFRYVAAGPLMQKEFAGLDTQLAAAGSIYPGLSRSDAPGTLLRGLVADGRLGAKSLRGFWEWTPETLRQAKAEYEATLMAALRLLKAPSDAAGPVPPSPTDSAGCAR